MDLNYLQKEILKMATINGAKALGLDKVGTLEVGNYADLIMLQTKGINGIVLHNLYENLVYSYGTEDIVLTMCNGKILYHNGKYFMAKSKNHILQKASQIYKKF